MRAAYNRSAGTITTSDAGIRSTGISCQVLQPRADETRPLPKEADRFGWAWITLCAALGFHIVDETATDFLSIYNPTVVELRRVIPFLIAPTFGFREWLTGLILVNAALFGLSPLAFRGNKFVRRLAYPFAGIMLLNGLAHIAGTIAGRTVSTVRFKRPMPGFWSSPLVIAASLRLANALCKVEN